MADEAKIGTNWQDDELDAIVAASMRSDLQVARLMAEAGARGALANVEINLDGLTDAAYVASMRMKIAALRCRVIRTRVSRPCSIPPKC